MSLSYSLEVVVVALLQDNIPPVELLANNEDSNLTCHWGIEPSWMFSDWCLVWDDNNAQIHLVDCSLEACHIDVCVVEHLLERPDDMELHTRHSAASSLGLLLIISHELYLEKLWLLTWQRLHGPNAMVHLTLDLESGHETRQVDLLCAAKACHLEG